MLYRDYINICMTEFVFRQDHKPLRYIKDSPAQNKKIKHWTTNKCGYNFKIEYIEGKRNVCVDVTLAT